MRRAAVAVLTAMAIPTAPAAAEPLVGVVGDGAPALVIFDSASASQATIHSINGLVATNEQIAGIDWRPTAIGLDAAGAENAKQLYMVTVVDTGATDALRLYSVDVGNGNATLLSGSPITVVDGDAYGVDFNPTADRLRVVNDGDENLRLNPNNGALSGDDTNLTPPGQEIGALAYTPAGALLGLAAATSNVVTTGNPNAGVMSVFGSTGLGALSGPENLNFDISSTTGAGFATAWQTSTIVPMLYSVNLGTGALTALERTVAALRGLAAVPASPVAFTTPALTVSEAAGAASFTITRGSPTNRTTQVGYAASDGSASGTLLFFPGETSKTVSIPIANDALDGPDRAVTLSLSGRDALVSLGGPATLTITDDDPPPDRTPPTLKVSASSSTTFAKFLKGVKVTVTPNEPAKLEIALAGTISSARISAYNTTLASKTLPLAGGGRSVTLKPSRKLVGKPRKNVKVRITVTATDAAGNRVTANRTLMVKRPR
jgi:hypothetical protein